MFDTVIKGYLESLPEDRDPTVISISSLGHCARRLAYRKHGVKGKPLTWRQKAIFDDGNRGHDQLRGWLRKGLIKKRSCYRLRDEEKEVTLGPLKGHVDGVLRHNPKCQKEGHGDRLLEVKTMHPFAYRLFENDGDIDFGYRAQIAGYQAALDLPVAVVLGKDKAEAQISIVEVPLDHELVIERLGIIDTVLKSTAPGDIEREYKPDESKRLPWQCKTCQFVETCWAEEGLRKLSTGTYIVDNFCQSSDASQPTA